MTNLLEIAQQAFDEHGAKLSVSDIALRAGVSRPTVYQQLGSKSEILAKLADVAGQSAGRHDLEGRLMRAVHGVASKNGFKAMKLDDVAHEAGIGVATIFRRFGSKDGLIAAFVAIHAPDQSRTTAAFSGAEGIGGLTAITDMLLAFMAGNRDLVRLVLTGSDDDRSYLRSLKDDTTSMSERLAAFFSDEIESGRIKTPITAEALARNLFGLVYAHVVLAGGTKGSDLAGIRDTIVEMFRPMFAKRET